MAFSDTPKLALPGGASKGDGAGTWVAQWNQLCANLEARLTKSGSGSPVGAVAGEYIGQQYHRTDVPQRWWCTGVGGAGVATWSDAVTLTGALTTNGNLTIAGGAVVSGGDFTLNSSRKLYAPTGNWLDQGGVVISPHAHAARHRPGATYASWTTPNDFLPFSIQQVRNSNARIGGASIIGTAIASQVFGAAGNAKCSITFSTSGRSTTSRGFLYGELWCLGTNLDTGIQMELWRATGAGIVGTVGTKIGGTVGFHNGFGQTGDTLSMFRYVTNLAASVTHEIALHAVASAPQDYAQAVQLIYIDLGTE